MKYSTTRNYLKRLLDVFIFLLVWIGIPHSLAFYTSEPRWYTMIIVTWLPGILIVKYLNDELE